MTVETNQERKRRQARDRKRKQRERERAHKEAVGARDFTFEMYRGTAEALERLAKVGDFEEQAEVLTLLIHGADKFAQRDPSRFMELISVTGRADEARSKR
ncbi:hypothetical protein [Marinobacterium stanieri]|uniref:hypothetical protein n=1 Tax=Marinobacterium stanieri TaxID=49186 RepID=UPI0002558855|nr:hypothetical protein [Marinobacterium stanieri]